MENKLIPSLKESLFYPSANLGDTLTSLIECGVDRFLEDGLLKDFPILSSIAAFCKTGLAIRERVLLYRTATFLDAYNNNAIDSKRLEKHRKALEANPKKAERELSRVIILLDRAIESRQAKNLGAFYRNYINGDISWSQFVELSDANDRLFIQDQNLLKTIFEKPIKENDTASDTEYKIQRLKALGLVIECISPVDGGSFDSWDNPRDRIIVSTLGELFVSMSE